MSQTDMQIVRENVIGMEASGVVVKSNSQWISEPVLVVRKDGDIRFCVLRQRTIVNAETTE